MIAEPTDLVYSENGSGPNKGHQFPLKKGLDKETRSPYDLKGEICQVWCEPGKGKVNNAKFSQSGEEDLLVDCVKRRG